MHCRWFVIWVSTWFILPTLIIIRFRFCISRKLISLIVAMDCCNNYCIIYEFSIYACFTMFQFLTSLSQWLWLTIKKYHSTSLLRMRQVQNSRLYIRYRRSSQKNEPEKLKNLTDYFPLPMEYDRLHHCFYGYVLYNIHKSKMHTTRQFKLYNNYAVQSCHRHSSLRKTFQQRRFAHTTRLPQAGEVYNMQVLSCTSFHFLHSLSGNMVEVG